MEIVEKNTRRMNAALKMFGVGNFYSVSANVVGATLQAEYRSEMASEILRRKFRLEEIGVDGYARFTRGNIKIVLT